MFNIYLRSLVKQDRVIFTLVLSIALACPAALGNQEQSRGSSAANANWQDARQRAEEYWEEFNQDKQQTWSSPQEAFRDGWIEGKLQASLEMNEQLSPFDIDRLWTGRQRAWRGKYPLPHRRSLQLHSQSMESTPLTTGCR